MLCGRLHVALRGSHGAKARSWSPNQVGIWRIPHKLTDVRSGHGEEKALSDVPPDQRKPQPHANGQKLLTAKNVFGLIQRPHKSRSQIDAKTGDLFVSVGSSGNIGEEPEVKATIQRFNADGSNQRTFAPGMRNPCGLAFGPAPMISTPSCRSATTAPTASPGLSDEGRC